MEAPEEREPPTIEEMWAAYEARYGHPPRGVILGRNLYQGLLHVAGRETTVFATSFRGLPVFHYHWFPADALMFCEADGRLPLLMHDLFILKPEFRW